METINQKNRCTYMVLADFSGCSNNALKYTISLAKVLPIHIHLFHVIEAIEEDEYQLDLDHIVVPKADAAMRKMEAMADIISTEGISVSYELSYGKLIKELDSHLEKLQPEVFVVPKTKLLDKKSSKLLSFLMTKYAGSFLMVEKDAAFSKETITAIAYNPENLLQYNWNVLLDINSNSDHNLNIIHSVKKNCPKPDLLLKNWLQLSNNEIEYDLKVSTNNSVTNGVIEATKTNQVDFICVGKSLKKASFLNPFFSPNTIASNLIKKLDIPVLVLGKN